MLESLVRTYEDSDLLGEAVEEVEAKARAAQSRLQDELAAVEAELRETEEALERYFRAFESGAMPESVCAPRIQALNDRRHWNCRDGDGDDPQGESTPGWTRPDS